MIDKHKILSNIVTLTFSEFANKGLIFFTSMYLLRTILPEGNGIMAFSSSFFSFFLLFVVFAFNTVGTREIAKDPLKTKALTDTIITTRIILAFVVYAAYAGILLSMNITIEKRIVTLIAGIALFANALNLDWVYQGLERMKVLATRQVMTSSATLLGYVLFVRSIDDIYLAAAISSASNLINVSWLLGYYIKTQNKFSLRIDPVLLKSILRSAIPLTLFTFSTTMLNQANVMIMEHYNLPTASVGCFNLAFRIVQFAVIPSSIIQMAFYPLLSRTSETAERRTIFRKYSELNLLGGIWTTSMIFAMPDFFVGIVGGVHFMDTVPLLSVYVFSVVAVYINTSFSPALIAWNFEKQVMYAIMIGSAISLVANIILIKYYGVVGATYSSIIGEAAISICLSRVLYKVLQVTIIKQFLKVVCVGAVVIIVGMLSKYFGLPEVANIICMSIVFILTAMAIKIVNINEIRGLIKR